MLEKLAEKIEEEVLDKYKAEDSNMERLTETEALRWNGSVYVEAGSTEYENGEKIAGQESSLC